MNGRTPAKVFKERIPKKKSSTEKPEPKKEEKKAA